MGRGEKHLGEKARRFAELVDKLDPTAVDVDDLGDIHAVAVKADAVNEAEAALRDAVLAARANGRSWNRIAIALGVSRQAARQRFGDKAAI